MLLPLIWCSAGAMRPSRRPSTRKCNRIRCKQNQARMWQRLALPKIEAGRLRKRPRYRTALATSLHNDIRERQWLVILLTKERQKGMALIIMSAIRQLLFTLDSDLNVCAFSVTHLCLRWPFLQQVAILVRSVSLSV